MLEESHGSLAGFDVGHMRAENLYALHLMLNHENLRDMNFGQEGRRLSARGARSPESSVRGSCKQSRKN